MQFVIHLMKLLVYIVFIIIMISSSIYYLVTTPTGLQVAWQISQVFIPGKIKVDNLQGTLLYGITFDKLTYQKNDVSVVSRNAKFSWHLIRLLRSPYYLDMDSVAIKSISLSKNKTEIYRISNITIIKDRHSIYHIRASLPQGKLQGDYQLAAAKSEAAINLNSDLSWLTPLLQDIHEIQHIQGNIYAKVSVSGGFSHPVIHAKINLMNGRFDMPEYNLAIRNITLTAKSISDNTSQVQGSFISGKGIGYISGNIKWVNYALSSTLQLRGNYLRVYNTREYKIDASPNLQFNYQENSIKLDGDIDIPNANITTNDFSGTVQLPSDVIIVNQQHATKSSSLLDNLHLAIRLRLSNHIHVDYEKFEGNLTGSIQVTQQPGTNMMATGELTVTNGRYRAYGRNLEIEDGRFIFTNSPLSNPGLDVKATIKIQTIDYEGESNFGDNNLQPSYAGTVTRTVGVIARGTVDKPVITLFSSPAGLSQGNILSYLLFGYPQSQISSASSLSLLNIASSMYGGASPANITSRIQNELGIEEFGVGSTEYYNPTLGTAQSTTTVNIGKHLAPNLSVHYSVGVFENVSVLNLRYQINRYLALQSETSTLENGGDLLYQIQSKD